jgi:hypothetical protein
MTDALGAALEAFIREREYCGELDDGVEDDRVWTFEARRLTVPRRAPCYGPNVTSSRTNGKPRSRSCCRTWIGVPSSAR